MANCYFCSKWIYQGQICDFCKWDKSHRPLSPQDIARLQREREWEAKNSFRNKLSPKGNCKISLVILGIIMILWPIGYYLGLEKEDATTVVTAILGSISGLGLMMSIVGTLWWCCADQKQNMKQENQEPLA